MAEPRFVASPRYALGELERAVEQAVATGDATARAKVSRWQDVLAGMVSGRLTVGSRTPVADTPAWVTLEVVHGGFATGRYLAEAPLSEDEQARVRSLPAATPGETDRERLNLWYLGDEGLAELRALLRDGSYRVDVPEESALLVVAWLMGEGRHEPALDLVAELRPLMHRLRMTPHRQPPDSASGLAVRLEPVGTVREALARTRVRPRIGTMLETLTVWHPLYDRLVALWCDTVDGELPNLSGTEVRGGWPCRVWPGDWAERRQAWLADYHAATREHGDHRHPKSNFARLRSALEVCEEDSRDLSGRDVGWIRRALANTIGKHGAPGSAPRAALRVAQRTSAARPTHAALAHVVAGRLRDYPEDGGIPSIDAVTGAVAEDEAPGVAAGHPIPAHLIAKVSRALEAPVEELVDRGVIGSGEVLAEVLPQLTSRLLAANIDDPGLRMLYARTYAAFRRRRSLLLLNLEHQVQFEELPWIGALAPFQRRRAATAGAARQSLRQTTLLALTAFPHAILPNPLVREIGALASRSRVRIPLVEEVAADIFMGTFTAKWRQAAAITSETMADTVYARYYDLPPAAVWERSWRARRWAKETTKNFAGLCAARAKEARTTRGGGYVAKNGAVLEQSQILTTHNLAPLVATLELQDRIRERAPELAARAFRWAVQRLAKRVHDPHAELVMIKNAAYAWRQAIFFLSFCQSQDAIVAQLGKDVTGAGLRERFGPAAEGLAHIVQGGRFTGAGTADGGRGRRFLGWSVGPHWVSSSAG